MRKIFLLPGVRQLRRILTNSNFGQILSLPEQEVNSLGLKNLHSNKQIGSLLFFLLLMLLFRSVCHQVSNQGDKLDLLAIFLLLADVSPTYSADVSPIQLSITMF